LQNFPLSLLAELGQIKDFDQQSFVDCQSQPAVTSIRQNPIKSKLDLPEGENVPWCSSGRYLSERPVFTLDPAYHAGAYYVQEASSMFLEQYYLAIAPTEKPMKILDLCAAPGGKSTHIASIFGNNSLIICNEVIGSRASILEENLTRWGNINTWVTCNDPKHFSKLNDFFDVIVVDAPCSGSGLFRKDKGALDEWSEHAVVHCAQRQKRILTDILPCLKPGGILIYSTCSFSVAENEAIADWIADNYSVASLCPAVPLEWGVTQTVSETSKSNCFRFFPNRLKGEGFFITGFQKTGAEERHSIGKFKSAHVQKFQQNVDEFLQKDDYVLLANGQDSIVAMHRQQESDFQILSKILHFKKFGLSMGQIAGNALIPSHELALSTAIAPTLPSITLEKTAALRFLKKEDPGIPIPPKGWYLIRYEGLNLGWAKSLGNRMNNYLPKNWRIRMELPE
jgi:NOL1/NOP2/sun family putative RNA methylase